MMRPVTLSLASRTQRGFSLIVSLMMLVVIIILGVGAAQMAINEERGARNDRDRQLAFQAAEAALLDAEYEILGPPGTPPTATGNCTEPGQTNVGWQRTGTSTCFNTINSVGFVETTSSPCSTPPNEGLCPYDAAYPAWRRVKNDAVLNPSGKVVDFLADAKGATNPTTVQYGRFTGRSFGSQQVSGMSGVPVSVYPPRYIIERVPQNTSVDEISSGGKWMYRVTAMGFGANANTQVVLQTVISTRD